MLASIRLSNKCYKAIQTDNLLLYDCLLYLGAMKNLIWMLLLFSSQFANANGSDTTQQHLRMVDYFIKGHFYGQVRNFTMSTINQGSLSDYYVNAIGASVHYETFPWKGFKVGLNGLFVYKTFSNELLDIDPIAGETASYELQLFDVEQPGNYTDLDRLEELYLHYDHRGFSATFGKMEIHTPLVNLHDGRMKPKVFYGIKSQYLWKANHFFAGWFTKASPRSITHWYSIGDAIGLYNNGHLEDGTPAHYHHHIDSKGLGIVGAETKRKKHFQFRIWNYFLENISNTVLANVEFNDSTYTLGFMYMNQVVVGNGGSDQLENTFFSNDLLTHAASARIGYQLKKIRFSLNGTHIFEGGNFLFPREFGVDPFYTFISRSQLEGFGNATAITFSSVFDIKKWELGLHFNHVKADEAYRYNKYDLQTYSQLNVDLCHEFQNRLEGLDLRFLYVCRLSNRSDLAVSQTFNKTNFHHLNLILNFNF